MAGAFPGAGDFIPARPSLKKLREAAQDCRGCDLYADATQAVMGSGPRDAPLMVVGEQPGDVEDRDGMPFVGPAGRLLDQALSEAGIDPEEVYKTNVVKHFRFSRQGKRRIHAKPDVAHVVACTPWLVEELAVVEPTGVILLGATAGRAVLGPKFRVGNDRGQLSDWPDRALEAPAPDWVLATTHPSAILRSRERESAHAEFVSDLRLAADALASTDRKSPD